jgi:hypothetical protein
VLLLKFMVHVILYIMPDTPVIVIRGELGALSPYFAKVATFLAAPLDGGFALILRTSDLGLETSSEPQHVR